MRSNPKTIKFYFILLLLRIFLDFCYYNVLVKNFWYNGYIDESSASNILISWVLLLYFSFPIKKLFYSEKTSFSNVTLYILSIISILPFTTLVSSGVLYRNFIFGFIIYWTLIFFVYFFMLKIPIKKKKIVFGNVEINDKLTWIFGIISIFTVLYISYKYTNFRFNFNLANVYELRSAAKVNYLSGITGYIFMASRIINVLFFAYNMSRKKYFAAAIFFVAQLLSFGIDGLKTTLFITILVFIMYLISNKKMITNYFFNNIVLYGLTVISLLGFLENKIFNSFKIIHLVIRRVLFDPIYLNFCYFDFFSKNTPDYFKGSFLKLLGFSSKYNNLGNIIGNVYFGRAYENCNNGLIADAITNMGYIGLFIMPIIIILLLRWLDYCTDNVDKRIVVSISMFVSILLSNTFLLPALITHGILISSFILLFMGTKIKGD